MSRGGAAGGRGSNGEAVGGGTPGERRLNRHNLALVSERLRLRPPHAGDVAAIHAALGDFEILKMLGSAPWPYERRHAVGYVAAAQDDIAAGTDASFLAFDGRALVGGVELSDIDTRPTIGWWITRSAWGHGFATEAVRAVLGHAFGPLGLNRLFAGAFVDNPASLRVQSKLGFKIVGRSELFCLARGVAVAHIDTILTRQRFREHGAS
ncbi:GNAT family N-acetyltransferase [Segnochrobactrum spirostomi]|uniref:GNAT family N-acetyltransferase n=1 Tax=Segnochrobactrum spirostomi TaxID=2608987 RepID=A0A6A7Y4X7_9HYPH|nr:GNAT family N-acetyltransferase [Segnochrobactrum spirostomi]MQT12782.1 GNAT family N-acetyltransferase [Segnochrobactrum spirostomi]